MNGGERRARRLLVIFNPTAGRRSRKRLESWIGHLRRRGAAVTLAETTGPGHAEDLARAADPAAFDAVAAAGGDGTINEVLNGLADSPLPLAVLPLGTANVVAAELGLPRRLAALAEVAAFAPVRMVRPGEILIPGAAAAKRFLLMAGVGFDAEVVEHVDSLWKRRAGKGAYVASIFGRLRDYHPGRYPLRIDGQDAAPASVVVARAHFYGGKFVLAPEASLDVAKFQVVLFEKPGRLAALGYLTALGLGLFSRCRDLSIVAADTVELLGPAGAPVQIDGDIRVRLPVTLRLAATMQGLIGPV
jgi:diacylglycerol kinase (ATP)